MKSILISLLCVFASFAFAKEKEIERKPASVKSFDGFPLDAVVDLPSGYAKNDVKKLIVFVHGSGPSNLEEDLSAVTEPKGTTNFFFRDLSDALIKNGIATLRYNKRAFEVKKRIEADKNYTKSEEFKKYMGHPLDYYIKDCSFFVDYARKEFPNADIFILGHSEGTGVALNVAKEKKSVKGVALIGFSNEKITSSLFEQVVYRQINLFSDFDKNNDGFLSLDELSGTDPIAKSFRDQMSVLDLDGDKKISLAEYKAGNYSNLVLRDDLYIQSYIVDEAKLPRPSAIIKDAQFKILFLQGEYDNQTPAYFAKSIQLVNNVAWKKKNLKFVFFEKAGHTLDPRNSLGDFSYRVLPTETLSKIAKEVGDFLN